MKDPDTCLNIGLVLLSSDFRVIGVNDYAKEVLSPSMDRLGKSVYDYHPKKSHEKITYLLNKTENNSTNGPVAMVIDVLNKVLIINLSRINGGNLLDGPCYAMNFIDVTRQMGAKRNPQSGFVELQKIPIYSGDSLIFIDASSVYYIKSDGNYCKAFTKNNSYYLHESLKGILNRYKGQNFFRVHKSYIANLSHVKEIKKSPNGGTKLVFDDISIPSIPVARRRMKALKQALFNHKTVYHPYMTFHQ